MKPICNRQKAAIWASAKEYGIDRQGVYDIIFAVSGQEHMTALTSEEAVSVLRRIKGNPESRKNNNRTDEGGNPDTVTLRRKIYMLTEQLGWNNNNERIEGFVRKHFGSRAELKTLEVWQCCKLIEILKEYVSREGG